MSYLSPKTFMCHTRALLAGVIGLLACCTPATCQQLASYVWYAAGSEHVVYIGADSHIHELYSSGNGPWQQNDLTANTCRTIIRFNPLGVSVRPANTPAITGPLAANPYGPIAGFVWSGDNSQHVTYVGQDGHLHDLSYNSGTCWNNTDLTAQVSGTSLPDASTGIASYDWPQDGSEHFIYKGQDGFIHEIYKGLTTGWGRSDFTSYPTAAGPVVGYVWPQDDSEHIVYMSPGGGLNELYLNLGGGWGLNNGFNGQAYSALGTALTGFVWPEDGTEHIDYIVEESQTPYELYYATNQGWNDALVSNNSNDPHGAAYNSQAISGYIWPSNHTEHVLVIDFNGHLHEYYLNRSGDHQWHDNDVTGSAAGNPPTANPSSVSGFAWDSKGIEHAFYFDCSGHVNDAWYIGFAQWQNQDLTQMTGAYPAFGCSN